MVRYERSIRNISVFLKQTMGILSVLQWMHQSLVSEVIAPKNEGDTLNRDIKWNGGPTKHQALELKHLQLPFFHQNLHPLKYMPQDNLTLKSLYIFMADISLNTIHYSVCLMAADTMIRCSLWLKMKSECHIYIDLLTMHVSWGQTLQRLFFKDILVEMKDEKKPRLAWNR